MLPKVATHILHHTSRAAATAHNYTFRNVLGLQSSTPSTSTGGLANWNGTGSSSWGGHGAGPGGAKYNTGSRFYNGYTVSHRFPIFLFSPFSILFCEGYHAQKFNLESN